MTTCEQKARAKKWRRLVASSLLTVAIIGPHAPVPSMILGLILGGVLAWMLIGRGKPDKGA